MSSKDQQWSSNTLLYTLLPHGIIIPDTSMKLEIYFFQRGIFYIIYVYINM